MLKKDLHKMGSENAHECSQNAENGFGFNFIERCHKDDGEFFNHVSLVTGVKLGFHL
jgi:hypothetical protein